MLFRSLRHRVRAAYLDSVHQVKALERNLGDRTQVDRRGVVDTDVDAAELVDGLGPEIAMCRIARRVVVVAWSVSICSSISIQVHVPRIRFLCVLVGRMTNAVHKKNVERWIRIGNQVLGPQSKSIFVTG